jgi:phosphoribosylformylglycinamidine synthase subunit PurL
MASLGEVTSGNFEVVMNGKKVIDEPIAALKGSWAGALEEQLAAEVVTA